jgi:hypothetical protein
MAASLHTGLFCGGLPENRNLFGLPLFNTQDGDSRGKLHLYGIDENGNRVYVIGRSRDADALTLVLSRATKDDAAGDVLLINALPCVTLLLRIGGFICCRLKLHRLGRPLVAAGLRQAYRCLKELVYRVKVEIAG